MSYKNPSKFYFCSLVIICLYVNAKAQIDTRFWFAAPDVEAATNYFDRPIALRLTSFANPATVTISLPADPSFTPITVSLAANSSNSVDLTPYINTLENSPANSILNKGILISSTTDITAYYEIISGYCNCNPEIYALKGKNALGTEFYVSTQTTYDVDTIRHPNATTSFEIVATEDFTQITILPTKPIIGHPAGVPFTITLNKGQTYSAVALYRNKANHLTSSHVMSTKPIALSIKEDLIFGDGSCADLAGDQSVPVSVLGTEYVVVRGFLVPGDRVFVLATEDNTRIYIDGNPVASATLAKGETWTYSFSAASTYIKADNKIYVYHVTGNGCEVGSAIIPKLNCTGSNSVSITRSINETFALMIFTKAGLEGNFTVNGNPATIPPSAFSPVPGTAGAYVAATIDLTGSIPTGSAISVSNSAGKFALGFVNGAAVGGCRYGFFSDFKSSNVEVSEQTLCQGDTVQLHAFGGIQYNWFPASGLSDPAAQAPQAFPDTTTKYTVYITDADGCVDSAKVTVQVTQCATELCTGSLGDPVVSITFGSGNNPGQNLQTIVPGASTTLQFISVSGNPANPTPVDGQYTITNNVPYNNAWFSGAPDHTPGDANGFMAFYNSQETPGLEFYRQTVNNLCGSTTYEFAAWVANCLNPAVMAGINPDITFRIEQQDGTLLATYNTGPIVQSPSLQWKQFGFYFTTPGNVNTVVLKMVNNSPGGNAQPGNDLAIDDITFRPCGPSDFASFDQILQKDTLYICEGSPFKLYGKVSAGYLNPGYLWQFSDDDGATWNDVPYSDTLIMDLPGETYQASGKIYRLLAGEGNNVNAGNCRISSNWIYLFARPSPAGSLAGKEICLNDPATLIFSSTSNSPPYDIVLTDGNQQFQVNQIDSGSTISLPSTGQSATTYYLVSIQDAYGCTTTGNFGKDTAIITIRSRTFNSPNDTSVCVGSQVVLNGNNQPDDGYLWSPSTWISDPNIQNPTASPPATTQYQLKVSDPICPYDSLFTVNIYVNPLPQITATRSNDIDCNTPTSQLTATGADSYQWTPASGLSNPSIASPIASIDTNTIFTVTGMDNHGCSSSDTVLVKVTNAGKPLFAVPNAFTPNGDGHNDCFGIKRWGNVKITEFSIYNRWGQRIFTTKNPGQCWDGTFNGVLQDAGGYAYVIRAMSICGEIKRQGLVILIR